MSYQGRHRKKTRLPLVAAAITTVAILAVIVAVAVTLHPSRPAAVPTAAAPAVVQPPSLQPVWVSPAAPVSAPSTVLPDGFGVVGVGDDLVPGLWVSQGGPALRMVDGVPHGCRYTRDGGTSWQTVGSPTSQVVVSLQNGRTFESHECATWFLLRKY